MPPLINSNLIQSYFSGIDFVKSISHSRRFFVEFWDQPTEEKRVLEAEIGPMPIILPWHVKSVTIPQYPFGKDVIKYGPLAKTFPVMGDFNGFDITILFEEDSQGTIAYFINWLQRKIIDREGGGVYRSQSVNRIDYMLIQTEDESGITISNYLYKNVYFQNASDVTYDYSSKEVVVFNVVFGADQLKFLPVKKIPGLITSSSIRDQMKAGLGIVNF
jgi:hypothetical protein